MELKYKHAGVLAIGLIGIGYFSGYQNRKTIIKIEEKVVEKQIFIEKEENSKTKETNRTEKTETTKEVTQLPDGTIITKQTDKTETVDISKEVEQKVSERLAQIEKEKASKSSTTTYSNSKLHLSLQAGIDLGEVDKSNYLEKYIYGAQIEYNFLGPAYLGGWGNNKKEFGISFGINL